MVTGLVKGLGGMPGILSVMLMLITTLGKRNMQDLIIKRESNKLQA